MANEIEKQIIHVFNAWGKTLARDTKRAIDRAIAADGGGQNSKLAGSVNYKVLNQGGVISFSLTMDKYWKFQDSGVDGTKVKHGSPYKFKKGNINQKAMLNFIERRHFKIELSTRRQKTLKGLTGKGIRKAESKLSYDKAKKSLAFVLGRSIAQKGIVPKKFMEKVITTERLDELKEMLNPLIRDLFVLEIKSALQ